VLGIGSSTAGRISALFATRTSAEIALNGVKRA
jgi:hypothetical protein